MRNREGEAEGRGRGGVKAGEGQRKVGHREKGKEMQKQNRKKGNHTVSCSRMRAIYYSQSVCADEHVTKKNLISLEMWVKWQARILTESHKITHANVNAKVCVIHANTKANANELCFGNFHVTYYAGIDKQQPKQAKTG